MILVDRTINRAITSKVMLPVSRILIVAILCATIGLHWIALQSIAWGMMIVSYSQSCSLSAAVAKTFDGEHPCDLCKRVSAAEHAPKRPAAQTTVAKPDLICAVTFRSLRNSRKIFDYVSFSVPINKRVNRPAIPPPRLLG